MRGAAINVCISGAKLLILCVLCVCVGGRGVAIGKTNSLCAACCTFTESGNCFLAWRVSTPLTRTEPTAKQKDRMGKCTAEKMLIEVIVHGRLAPLLPK